MSITKNTQRRKKVASQNARPAAPIKSPAKPPLASLEVASAATWRALDEEVSQLLRRVSAPQRLTYAALFHAAMQALRVAWRRPSAKRRREVAELLNHLQQESRNRGYRRILRAMAAAAEQSDEAMKRAYQTARLAVQTVFEWSEDYRFVFGDYEPKRKPAGARRQVNK
jgi:hypothetical protein